MLLPAILISFASLKLRNEVVFFFDLHERKCIG